MRAAVPVGTLAIGKAGAVNAALLAAEIVALEDDGVRGRLKRFRATQTQNVLSHPDPADRSGSVQVGIVGGGQLGRMLALAGHPLDIRCRTLDPAGGSPASTVPLKTADLY